MNLPQIFLSYFEERMDPEEFRRFLASYGDAPWEGIRCNTLKIGREGLLEVLGGEAQGIPWCPDGFYYDPGEGGSRLSVHPRYHAGLYYMQEPSAMYPAELLDPRPGERILDLCAAPGGKTTQIAMKMQGKGLLVANEISPKRVKALRKNIELYGISNAIVTNTTGKHLLETYGGTFDRVLVDAPCSGEGTFRKDKRSVREYGHFSDESLLETQRDILDYAFRLLKPGGTLVYSTCTFNARENEEQIDRLLRTGRCSLVEPFKQDGMADGRPEWTASGNPELKKAVRFWPHLCKGEGHFAARLLKEEGEKGERGEEEAASPSSVGSDGWKDAASIDPSIRDFFRTQLGREPEGWFTLREGFVYLMDEAWPYRWKNRIENLGRCLGELSRHGFVPHQSLIMTFRGEDLIRTLELDEADANRYLKGETLAMEAGEGFHAVLYEGQPLGWAKITNGFFKNLYDKKWRKSY